MNDYSLAAMLDRIPKMNGTVAIWRTEWLRPSETFIRNQTDALSRWRSITLARSVFPGGLGVPTCAPFNRSLVSRLLWNLAGPRSSMVAYKSVINQADVKVMHAHFGHDAVTALPIAEACNLPLIVTFHGYDVTRRRSGVGSPRSIARKYSAVFDYATTLVAVSQFVGDKLKDLGADPSKTVVHYIGVPVTKPRSPVAHRNGVVFAGRLVEKKGVEHLLRAYAMLPAQIRKAHPLRIAGRGTSRYEAKLQQLARCLSIEPSFLGWLTPTQVAELVSAGAVFCAPSITAEDGDSEGFGLVFLEAALNGAPAVAYRHGGVPEAVVDGVTGLLANEGDIGGLATNLTRLLTDADLAARMSQAGRARVLRHFDIAANTQRLESIYDAAVGRG